MAALRNSGTHTRNPDSGGEQPRKGQYAPCGG